MNLTPKQRRALLITAIALGVAALVGLLVWWLSKPSPNEAPQEEAPYRGPKRERPQMVVCDTITLLCDTLYRIDCPDGIAFLRIDSIAADTAAGVWYQVVPGEAYVAVRSVRLSARELDSLAPSHYRTTVAHPLHDARYRSPLYKVDKQADVVYSNANGYWASLPIKEGEPIRKTISEGLTKSISRRTLPLTLDIYSPQGNPSPAPAIVMLHGGAFYVGDKGEQHIADLCRHFASMGYVAVSVNYRMGFRPAKKDIANTMRQASNDLLAATHYLLANADRLGIDTARLFLAGTSAGAITALSTVFSRGCDVRFLAVANMWGALPDLALLRHAHTSIVSFHGDADPLVPYNEGYPFSNLGNGQVGKLMFGKMYGSQAIHKAAQKRGIRSRLHTFPGAGHALHLNDDHSPNPERSSLLRDSIAAFFYEELVPQQAVIIADAALPGHYSVRHGAVAHWHVEGGFILQKEGGDIYVAWIPDVPHLLEASGYYTIGIGFTTNYRL